MTIEVIGNPEPHEVSRHCLSCGERVWYTFVVPDDVWKNIAPLQPFEHNGGGVLCVRCMDRRCEDLGIETTGTFHYYGKALTSLKYPPPPETAH